MSKKEPIFSWNEEIFMDTLASLIATGFLLIIIMLIAHFYTSVTKEYLLLCLLLYQHVKGQKK
ncbi:hypothetical protein LCGC14_2355250 [marine sediment metagenome]|uniref:Uncharacterized protein n=1 Tax=marine sediment metagenome TaxID=412755 RepID=A0A0F9F2Z8_9ZZZZ